MPVVSPPPEIRTIFFIYQDVAKRPSPASLTNAFAALIVTPANSMRSQGFQP
jgi:hypothetical protein